MFHERDRDAMTDISTGTGSAQEATRVPSLARADAPLEKIALETYLPPAKPSLVGMSRAEIAEQLGAIGVAPALDLCPRREEF
jgi:23S rRNA (adenine2503-C2)-methyltransferase